MLTATWVQRCMPSGAQTFVHSKCHAESLTCKCPDQAHELGASCLTHLAAARQLASLSLEGIPRMGSDGW